MGYDFDTTRQRLLSGMSISLFCEAVNEAPDAQISMCIDAFKEGDTLRLGNLIRDMVNDCLDATARYESTGESQGRGITFRPV